MASLRPCAGVGWEPIPSAGSAAALDSLALPRAQTHLPDGVGREPCLSSSFSFSRDRDSPKLPRSPCLRAVLEDPEVGLQLWNLGSSFASYFYPNVLRTCAFPYPLSRPGSPRVRCAHHDEWAHSRHRLGGHCVSGAALLRDGHGRLGVSGPPRRAPFISQEAERADRAGSARVFAHALGAESGDLSLR